MKLLPVFLLNLATVVIAFVVYDQLRSEATTPGAPVESGSTEIAALDRRIRALEAKRRPYLGDAGIDKGVVERLDALEEAVRTPAATGGQPTAERAPGEMGPTRDDQPSPTASPDDASPEAVREFRRLQEAVRREESIERNKAWVDAALDALQLNLTTKQRSKILAAYAAFEPRKGEIWNEAKSQAQKTIAAGGAVDRGEIVTNTAATIQQEFAKTLTGFVHQADAEAIAEALNPKGR